MFNSNTITTTFLLISSLLGSHCTTTAVLLPRPKGKYAVAHNTAKLIDTPRLDPFNPSEPRNVMISLYYPVAHSSCERSCNIPYMPPKSASFIGIAFAAKYGVPNGTLSRVQMEVCCKPCQSAYTELKKNNFPLVLFSPGLGGTSTRLLHGAMARELASRGYVVVTMDHTYEKLIVEYPDGRYTLGVDASYWAPEDPAEYVARYQMAIDARLADARFVLTQLGKGDVVKRLVPGAKEKVVLNTRDVAMFGHSFGGATAVTALAKDGRFKGAINLDGTQVGLNPSPLLPESSLPADIITKPVLLFSRGEPSPHNRSMESDPTWAYTWDYNLKGWRQEISLKGAAHYTFTDEAVLLQINGLLSGEVSEEVKQNVGWLEAQRGFEIIGKYVEAFMGFVLKGARKELLEKPSREFPEIEIGE